MSTSPSKVRRPRSGGRKLLALAIFALALLVVRLIWGVWSGRKLDEAMAAMRARGEAVEAAEVTFSEVPDEENAWTLQLQAINSQTLAAESPRNSNMMYVGYPPYRPRWWRMAEASERAHANAFALMRQSRQRSRVQLRDRLTTPLFNNFLLPRINGARGLANSLADGAELMHLRGDDAESIERILDLLHLTRSLRHDDFLVSQLVCIGIDALTCWAVQTIAPGLKIGPDAPAATPRQVRQLIDMLLDEREAREGMARAVAMERLIWIDFCRTRAAGTWFTRPLADAAIRHAVQNFDFYRRAVECGDMPAAQVAA